MKHTKESYRLSKMNAHKTGSKFSQELLLH